MEEDESVKNHFKDSHKSSFDSLFNDIKTNQNRDDHIAVEIIRKCDEEGGIFSEIQEERMMLSCNPQLQKLLWANNIRLSKAKMDLRHKENTIYQSMIFSKAHSGEWIKDRDFIVDFLRESHFLVDTDVVEVYL